MKITDLPPVDLSDPQWVEITYNPYKGDTFVTRDRAREWGAPVEHAERVIMTPDGKVYGYGVTEADVAF